MFSQTGQDRVIHYEECSESGFVYVCTCVCVYASVCTHMHVYEHMQVHVCVCSTCMEKAPAWEPLCRSGRSRCESAGGAGFDEILANAWGTEEMRLWSGNCAILEFIID